ncbi:ABC transporter ATP-binding protein [Tropicimonas sp. IMCC34043]|uniref:ABC transporter ATP-binding protein n=1 Tax=Tropicimonas sp. IMCC34043 TaxID=2248760 RepID=UPI0018E500BF|nr:ABC transporter ATP-binding protein [Tropicimonas sp. IMCC34043]
MEPSSVVLRIAPGRVGAQSRPPGGGRARSGADAPDTPPERRAASPDTLSRPWRLIAGGLLDSRTAPWLLPLLQARQRRLALLFLLGLVGAGIGLLPPWITKLVIDRGLVAGDASALVAWSLALFAVGLAALGLGALSSVLHMRASVTMLADLRRSLIGAVLTRPPSWRAQHQTGELMARIDGDAAEVQKFAFNALLTGSGALVRLCGGAILLAVLNWKLALLAASLAPLELLFFARARPRTERLARDSRAARGRFAGQLGEIFAGLGSLQAVGAEAAVSHRIEAAQRDLNARTVAAHLWGEATRAVPQVLSALVRGAVFLAGGLAVIRGDWPLGSLIAFLAYLGFLTGPTQSLIGLWHAQARTRAALDRIGGLLQAADTITPPSRPRPLPRTGGAICFDAVTLRGLFRPVNAEIAPGEACLLTGASGIGKSSLLALLHRHADPDAGRVLLDGIDLRQIDPAQLRRAVTLVPQRPFVLRASLAENLRLTCPEASDATLHDRLALVELDERFRAAGLSAVIGEDGLTVSGGERQRLCLARALVAPGRVIVLDEALSEVDAATAARIMARLHARWADRTRIITTHGDAGVHGPFDRILAPSPA